MSKIFDWEEVIFEPDLNVELPIKFVNRVQTWESEDRAPVMKAEANLRRLYCPECQKMQKHKVYADRRTFCCKCWHSGELALEVDDD